MLVLPVISGENPGGGLPVVIVVVSVVEMVEVVRSGDSPRIPLEGVPEKLATKAFKVDMLEVAALLNHGTIVVALMLLLLLPLFRIDIVFFSFQWLSLDHRVAKNFGQAQDVMNVFLDTCLNWKMYLKKKEEKCYNYVANDLLDLFFD